MVLARCGSRPGSYCEATLRQESWCIALCLNQSAIDVQVVISASDAHSLLGVPQGAPKDVIKRAYRKLVLRTHPDIAHDGSQDRFIQVSLSLFCALWSAIGSLAACRSPAQLSSRYG